MATYTTFTDVASELGGVTLNASSTPTSTVVDGWIQDAEREVEVLTGQVFSTMSVSSTTWEYHDYDGTGVIRLDNFPVQSIELLQYEEKGLGSNEAASWVTLLEGRSADENFVLYGDVGAIRLYPNSTSNNPRKGRKNIRVAYTYGYTSVPREIKSLVTKMAAKRYIGSVANESSTTGGGAISVGAISISDPTNYVMGRLTQIDSDIDRMMEKVVGRFRVTNYDVNLYG